MLCIQKEREGETVLIIFTDRMAQFIGVTLTLVWLGLHRGISRRLLTKQGRSVHD